MHRGVWTRSWAAAVSEAASHQCPHQLLGGTKMVSERKDTLGIGGLDIDEEKSSELEDVAIATIRHGMLTEVNKRKK